MGVPKGRHETTDTKKRCILVAARVAKTYKSLQSNKTITTINIAWLNYKNRLFIDLKNYTHDIIMSREQNFVNTKGAGLLYVSKFDRIKYIKFLMSNEFLQEYLKYDPDEFIPQPEKWWRAARRYNAYFDRVYSNIYFNLAEECYQEFFEKIEHVLSQTEIVVPDYSLSDVFLNNKFEDFNLLNEFLCEYPISTPKCFKLNILERAHNININSIYYTILNK